MSFLEVILLLNMFGLVAVYCQQRQLRSLITKHVRESARGNFPRRQEEAHERE